MDVFVYECVWYVRVFAVYRSYQYVWTSFYMSWLITLVAQLGKKEQQLTLQFVFPTAAAEAAVAVAPHI